MQDVGTWKRYNKVEHNMIFPYQKKDMEMETIQQEATLEIIP